MKTWLAVFVVFVLLGLLLTMAGLLPPKTAKSQVASITFDWTAPGDDGVVGTASSYEMRLATTRPDTTSTAAFDSWWNAATPVTAMPAPTLAGTTQSKTVLGPFATGFTYYAVMRACDEVPNCSPYSNVAAKFLPDNIPPSRVLDLRPR